MKTFASLSYSQQNRVLNQLEKNAVYLSLMDRDFSERPERRYWANIALRNYVRGYPAGPGQWYASFVNRAVRALEATR